MGFSAVKSESNEYKKNYKINENVTITKIKTMMA